MTSKEPSATALTIQMPDSRTLAAVGRVTISHGYLDLGLRRMVQTLAGLTRAEADKALSRESASGLRDLVRRLAATKLGKASTATLKLRALLAECERVTERRNSFVHDYWAATADGEQKLVGRDMAGPAPSAADIDKLVISILNVTRELGESRAQGGFVYEALKAGHGLTEIAQLKKSQP